MPGQARVDAPELNELVTGQIRWWEEKPPIGEAKRQRALERLNTHSRSVFILSIRDRRVAVWPKTPVPTYSLDWTTQADQWDAYCVRVTLYKTYLEHVLAHAPDGGSFDMALDVNDIPQDSDLVPVLAFQRRSSGRNPLLPDPDFFEFDWYGGEDDPHSYEDKTASACFVGSSTGRWLDGNAVQHRLAPRLRAASHFCNHPHVTFRIATAAQCASKDVEQLLRRQSYFGARMGWSEQLSHRLLISMDGNGAACSRLARALRSHSALIKYASDFELYYFGALRNGQHFVQVETEDDVERTVYAERAQPGRFKAVADAGRSFAQRFLTPGSALTYTSLMLSRIARMQ